MNNHKTISREFFYEYLSKCMEIEDNLDYEWNNNNTELTIKKKSEEGFDVIVRFEVESFLIDTDIGWHDEFGNSEERLDWLMGVIRDLLSKNMRIRVISSNEHPYKWIVELFNNSKWGGFLVKHLMFWKILGKKSEKFYTNDILPPRDF